VVLTDGWLDAPPEPPFTVLWATTNRAPDFSEEPYGTVVDIYLSQGSMFKDEFDLDDIDWDASDLEDLFLDDGQ